MASNIKRQPSGSKLQAKSLKRAPSGEWWALLVVRAPRCALNRVEVWIGDVHVIVTMIIVYTRHCLQSISAMLPAVLNSVCRVEEEGSW